MSFWLHNYWSLQDRSPLFIVLKYMKLTSGDLIGAFQSCGATRVMGHELQMPLLRVLLGKKTIVKSTCGPKACGPVGCLRVPHPRAVECKVLNALRTPRVQNSRGDGSAILGTVYTTIWNFWEFILGAPSSKGHWLTRRQPETGEWDGKELGKISSKKELEQGGCFDQKNGDTMAVLPYLSCAGETALVPCCPREQSGRAEWLQAQTMGQRDRAGAMGRGKGSSVRFLLCNCTANPLSLLVTLLSSLCSPGQCGESHSHQKVLWLELLWAAVALSWCSGQSSPECCQEFFRESPTNHWGFSPAGIDPFEDSGFNRPNPDTGKWMSESFSWFPISTEGAGGDTCVVVCAHTHVRIRRCDYLSRKNDRNCFGW